MAQAPEAPTKQPQRPEAETHDGLMMRFTLGFGYSGAESERGAPDELAVSGTSSSYSFDIGAAVAENWILHARYSDLTMYDPTVSVAIDAFGESEGVGLSSTLLAPAVTYSFMPANIYLTLALGVAWLEIDRSTTSHSDAGFGANLDLGKEWWVSDNWGLGLTARFWFTNVNVPESFSEVAYNMFGSAVLFSATYN